MVYKRTKTFSFTASGLQNDTDGAEFLFVFAHLLLKTVNPFLFQQNYSSKGESMIHVYLNFRSDIKGTVHPLLC